MMKGKILFSGLIILLIWVSLSSLSWARMFVTNETRSWAKKVVEREKGLESASQPNTLAVIDFYNKTEWDKLDPLQKGLALMLMTDLYKVKKCFQLVERAKVRALQDELALQDASLTASETQHQVGELLGAENVVGGDIIKKKIGNFGLNSNLLEVRNQKVFGQPSAEGELLEGLFEMEKDLLFEILKELQCEISPEEEEALRKHITLNINALLKVFMAVEAGDEGDYEQAEELYKAALVLDPSLDFDQGFLEEIDLARSQTGYLDKRAEGYSEEITEDDYAEKDVGRDEIDPVNDPPDRDIDDDGDGYTVTNGDCDDSNPTVNPGAIEACNNRDDDCDGSVDEGCDNDNDGDGYTVSQGDCDDNDPAVHPGATEVCNNRDDDCDGSVDEGFDNDGDGYTTCGGDCDDNDPAINPGGTEECNNKDDNCDGNIDEGFDNDHDGYRTCDNDCDDTDPAVHPGATEICNNRDDNCDGNVDEDLDADSDGWTECGGDCNDNDRTMNPDATEYCNNRDDNCDGRIDEGFDIDGDGWTTCEGDCNDSDGTVNPHMSEIMYNGKDDDCNSSTPDTDFGAFNQPPIVDSANWVRAVNDYFIDGSVRQEVDADEHDPGNFDPGGKWITWHNTDDLYDVNKVDYTYFPDAVASDGRSKDSPYLPVFQAVGSDYGNGKLFLDPGTLGSIQAAPLLAYAVQLEEHGLGEYVLNRYRDEAYRQGESDLVGDIDSQLALQDIRVFDNYLLKKADAQAGRVLRDREGHWVRVQQYILRPSEDTVQMLNVSLRSGGSKHAGLSTISFTAEFDGNLSPLQNLKNLPWDFWLRTDGSITPPYNNYDTVMEGMYRPDGEPRSIYVTPDGPLPSKMSVALKSPSGSLTETRHFDLETGIDYDPGVYNDNEWHLNIKSEVLDISLNSGYDGNYRYVDDWDQLEDDEYWVWPDPGFVWWREAEGNNPAPFYYMRRSDISTTGREPMLWVQLFVVGDGDTDENRGVRSKDYSDDVAFRDIWDTLRVNGSDAAAPQIDGNNLEIVFFEGANDFLPPNYKGRTGNDLIDVNFIPMSRMLWNTRVVAPVP